jgi:uncharacterized protein (DUF433 family)
LQKVGSAWQTDAASVVNKRSVSLRGTPVFKGTRIPVDLVADMLAQGVTAEEILEGYPTLSKEKIAIAPLYMRAFPRRGRPSRRPWQGKKARGRKSFRLSTLLRSA